MASPLLFSIIVPLTEADTEPHHLIRVAPTAVEVAVDSQRSTELVQFRGVPVGDTARVAAITIGRVESNLPTRCRTLLDIPTKDEATADVLAVNAVAG